MEASGAKSGGPEVNKRKRSNEEAADRHDPGEGPSTSKKVNRSSEPDNETTESQRSSPNKKDVNKMRLVEEQAKHQVSEKVRRIVKCEFGKSLKDKEHEIEQVDERILQVQKALHVVRYGCVTDFYARSVAKQTNAQPENVSIHPAVRRLLGGKAPRKASTSSSSSSSATTSTSTSTSVATSTKLPPPKLAPNTPKKTEVKSEEAQPTPAAQLSVLPGYVPPKADEKKPKVLDPRGIGHKVKRRFVIGNVSKWIQCDQREDMSTHKWMIYVRGDKDNPDVSDVVKKVRFLIHASYHPHDLIEVEQSPFHLTRRGWGEFPARVQIHFKNPLDKSIDVIHHLKLDKSYTGLQTLGAETVIDLWLHDPEFLKARKARQEALRVKGQGQPPMAEMEPTSEGWVIAHSDINDLREILPGMETQSGFDLARVKTEPVDISESSDVRSKSPSVNESPKKLARERKKASKTTYIRCTGKDGKSYYLPVTFLPDNHQKHLGNNTIKTEVVHNGTNGASNAVPASVGSGKKLKQSNERVTFEVEPVSYKNEVTFTPPKCKSHSLIHNSNASQQNGHAVTSNPSLLLPNGSSVANRPRVVSPCATRSTSLTSTSTAANRAGVSVLPPTNRTATAGATGQQQPRRPLVPAGTSLLKGGVSLLKRPLNSDQRSLGVTPASASPGISLLPPQNAQNATSLLLTQAQKKLQEQVNLHQLNVSSEVVVTSTPVPEEPVEVSELEQAVPEVSIDLWKRILGRTRDEDQIDLELRVAKRGSAMVKSYVAYHVTLSDKVFKLQASDFDNAEYCILYVARFLPLVTLLAKDPYYRCLHPYSAKSEEDFNSWSRVKQKSAEWSRAKLLGRILENIDGLKPLATPTKEIVRMLREHGFIVNKQASPDPLALPAQCRTQSSYSIASPDMLNCDMNDSKSKRTPRQKHVCKPTSDSIADGDGVEVIDVVSLDDQGDRKVQKHAEVKVEVKEEPGVANLTGQAAQPRRSCLVLPEDVPEALTFVRATARQIGVDLGHEEIAPKIYYPAAQKLILRAWKNMCERLIRKAYRSALLEAEETDGGQEVEVVTARHLQAAIAGDPSLAILGNGGLGKKHLGIKEEPL